MAFPEPLLSRARCGRTARAVAVAALLGGVVGCGRAPAGPAPGGEPLVLNEAPDLPKEPDARLRALLAWGSEPGHIAPPFREEIERLVGERLLPATEGELAGQRWRVTYLDLPLGDFVAAELVPEPQLADERSAWVHVFHRRTPSDRALWNGPRLRGFPTRGEPGHHRFVRIGDDVEVRAAGSSPAFREPGRLERLLEGFRLEALADPAAGG